MYEIGCEVIIKQNLDHASLVENMRRYEGSRAFITDHTEHDDYYRLNVDSGRWYWHKSLFRLAPTQKNKRMLVDFINGKYGFNIQMKE